MRWFYSINRSKDAHVGEPALPHVQLRPAALHPRRAERQRRAGLLQRHIQVSLKNLFMSSFFFYVFYSQVRVRRRVLGHDRWRGGGRDQRVGARHDKVRIINSSILL